MNEERILGIISQLMDKLSNTQRLQNLAKENDLAYKPVIDFSDEAIDNIVVSMIALTLASQAKDSRYDLLVRTGIQKRSLKTEIINDFKDEALHYLDLYKRNLVAPQVWYKSIPTNTLIICDIYGDVTVIRGLLTITTLYTYIPK